MRTYIYSQGGSASKTIEALVYMIGAGLIKKGEEIYIIICDKDHQNGDTGKMIKALNSLISLSNPTVLDTTGADGFPEKSIFKILVTKDGYDFTAALERVLGTNNGNKSLSDGIAVNNDDSILLNAFFKKSEQNDITENGFEGSASKGAVFFSHLLLNDGEVFEPVKEYLKNHPNEDVKVFIVGSIFGGTGSSQFLRTAEAVKDLSIETIDGRVVSCKNRIHVAGALILPYFEFNRDENCSINSSDFWPKSVTSLSSYAEYSNFIKKSPDDENGILDRLYLSFLPNFESHFITNKTQTGGAAQTRKSDVLDMITASFIVDFINAEATNSPENPTCYSLPDSTNLIVKCYPENINENNKLTLECIPDARKKFSTLLSFSAFAFYLKWSIKNTEQNDKSKYHHIAWLAGRDGIFDRTDVKKHSEVISAVKEELNKLYDFCSKLVDFACEIADTGIPAAHNGTQDTDISHYFGENYNLFVNCNRLASIRDSIENGTCKLNDINEVLAIDKYCDNFKVSKTAFAIRSDSNIESEIRAAGHNHEYARQVFSAYIIKAYEYLDKGE